MKRSSSFGGIRLSIILMLFVGMLSVSIFFMPYETSVVWLNRLASDGNFASFTVESHRVVSRWAGLIGLVCTVLSGAALVGWKGLQRALENFTAWRQVFGGSLRRDARMFLDSLSFSKWTLTERWLMAGLMLTALIMRLASLYIPLAHDEAYTYNAFASRSLWVAVSDYHLPNNHVFLTIIINILTHVFGNHLWLIRLPTVMAGMLMVPVAFVLGRRWYGSEAGLLGAGLVAVFPILVEYSALARGYSFVSLFTLLTLVFGDQVRENKNRFVWLLLIVANALGFFSIPIMLFPFGALYIWLFLSGVIGDIHGYRSKLDFLKYWLASGFASAFLTVFLYAPILIGDTENFFGNSFVLPLSRELFPVIFWSRAELTWSEWMRNIPGWLSGMGVAGVGLATLLHFKISRQKLPMQVIFFLWIAAYLISRRPDMMLRMWQFLAAPLLIWSAGGWIGTMNVVANLFRRKLPLVQVLLGASLTSIFLLGLFTLPTIPARWAEKSSVEKAALYLKENLRDGDLVTASVEYFPQLRYYFGIHKIDQDYLRKSGQFRRAFIVMGERKRRPLEDAIPMMGRKNNIPAVDVDKLRIVLEFDDLLIYEGEHVP